MFNSILPKHRQQKQESQNIGFFGLDCKPQQVIKDKKLRLDIKCMINQEILVMKSNNQDQSMSEVKIEYSLFIDKKYFDSIPSLKENYSQEQDVVQIIVVCSQGIHIPTDQDFLIFFESFDQMQEKKNLFKTYIADKPQKFLYRLLIVSIILNSESMRETLVSILIKNLNLYVLFKLALITTQYEWKEYSKYFYELIVQYYQFISGVYQTQISNQHLQTIIMNVAQVQLQQPKDDVIIVLWDKKQLQIATVFFRPLYKNIENRKKKFFQPLQKYQFYKNLRKKSQNVTDSDYPHYYKLQDEAEGKQFLIAYQESPHSEILIFEKDQIKYIKYSEEYVGVVERNFWGTVFQVFDFGYPKEVAIKIPKYFGQERREILNIQYETNIMATSPRKFTATMLNFTNNQLVQLGQMDPVYNHEKECYQLNFFGRAKRASARNFEVIDPEDANIIYLLHGKWEKNLFNVDYRFPMNMVQAFSFSLSSVSKKFLVQ